MKHIFLLAVLLLLISPLARTQEPPPIIISTSFTNLPFEEFVDIIKEEYGLKIFYKPEWVEGISVNSFGDSLTLDDILYSTLEPRSVKFVKRNEYQYFLTGPTTIDVHKPPELLLARSIDSSMSNSILNNYFNRFSFEKTFNKIVLGDRNNRASSPVSIISGKVFSKISGEPILGATLYIEGTNNGVISDKDGNYSISAETGSTITLQISCLGLDPETYLVDLYGSGVIDIGLTEKLIDIEEIIITSEKNDNIKGMQMGFQRIEMKNIKNIPMVFGERDILKMANMSPGVQSAGEGSSGINVRGSSSDQNLFLLNGIPVLNTGHMFGFFSAFNPDMIDDLKLFKSSYPVEYGGRLSSIFEISTKDGNKKDLGIKGRISPITGSLLFETPIIKDKSSIIVGVRSTYSDWILNKIDDPDIRNSNASFNDIMIGLDMLGNNKSSWHLFGYLSNDKFTLSNSEDFKYGNIGASLIWDKNLNDKWKMEIAGIISNYSNYHSNRLPLYSSYEHEFSVKSQEFKINFSGIPWFNHKLDFGSSAILHKLNYGKYEPFEQGSLIDLIDFGKEVGIEYSIFLSDEVSISEKLSIYGGLRYSTYNFMGPNSVYQYSDNSPFEHENIIDTLTYNKGERISQYKGPEYRVSINYEIDPDMSVKFSMNRMTQYLFMLSNTISQSPIDRWKLADNYIIPPVSDQFSIGFYKNLFGNSIETSAEVYYKIGKNIVEYKDGADLTKSPDFETYVLQGDNRAYGLELMFKGTSKSSTVWLSYTWSRSFMTVDGKEAWERINEGITYPANYDKPHSIKFVGNIKLSRRWSIASNIIYNSGRPITFPTDFFYLDDIQIVDYSTRNEYRIPDYFRIDASVNLEGNLRSNKTFHGAWSFSVYNITGRKNAYSVYLKNVNGKIRGYKQSIYGVPIFTISYNIKLGNYATD